jgi:hypothetical protein
MKTLQEIFKEFNLMTVPDCLKELEWTSEKDFEKDGETGQIICDCGGMIKTRGWVGAESAYCPNCHKGMQDMTGFLPLGKNYSGSILENKEIEIPKNGKIWTPVNIWGY